MNAPLITSYGILIERENNKKDEKWAKKRKVQYMTTLFEKTKPQL